MSNVLRNMSEAKVDVKDWKTLDGKPAKVPHLDEKEYTSLLMKEVNRADLSKGRVSKTKGFGGSLDVSWKGVRPTIQVRSGGSLIYSPDGKTSMHNFSTKNPVIVGISLLPGKQFHKSTAVPFNQVKTAVDKYVKEIEDGLTV